MPKISIITTTYKHEKFVRDTIESVLAQTFTDWELLIGDDSPNDATWDIIQEYVQKDSRIKAWHHAPNKGIVGNMNSLVAQISPDSGYITFLEGDDRFTPENLEEKIKIFERFPKVQLVYSDLDFIDGSGKIILKSFFNYRHIPFFQNAIIPKDTFILLPAGPIASWSTSMVRRQMIEEFPIKTLWEDIRYSASDYDWYFEITTRYPVYGIRKSLTQYRRHSNNLSGANGGTSFDLERLIDIYYEKRYFSKTVYQKKKSWLAITFAIFALEHGEK